MKLFHTLLFVFPLVLFLFSVSVSSEEKLFTPNPIETIGKDTEWLNADYLKTLTETKSTFKASKDIYYSAMVFKLNEKTIEWMQCYNFHEGITFILQGLEKLDDGSYMPVLDKSQEKYYSVKDNRLTFSGNPVNKIEWSFIEKYDKPGEHKHLTFIRAEPDLKTAINRLTIAGKYKDEKGLLYTFTEDGKAVWPERSFDYEVVPDNVLTHYDYFMTSVMVGNNTHEFQGFEWKNGKLFIYKLKEKSLSEFFIKDDIPFLILTPVE